MVRAGCVILSALLLLVAFFSFMEENYAGFVMWTVFGAVAWEWRRTKQ